jgi:hypothetical protein
MMPHSIRLRHPWEELPATVAGIKVFRRRFNSPTGLDPWETVSLEIDRIPFAGSISLNGEPLGEFVQDGLFSSEITALLKPNNELIAEIDLQKSGQGQSVSHSIYIVDPDEPPGSPIGEVRLVIRAKSRDDS